MDFEKITALSVSFRLSEKICKKIAIQTERHFQKVNVDSISVKPMKNFWDNICYEIQREGGRGIGYVNELEVREYVYSLVKKLENYEFNAIFLQVESLCNGLSNVRCIGTIEPDRYEDINLSSEDNELSPVILEVIDYIAQEYIYKRAKGHTNKRLRKAILSLNEIKKS